VCACLLCHSVLWLLAVSARLRCGVCASLEFLRPHTSTAAIERVYAAVRAKVPFIEKDVYLAPYINAVWQLVRDGDILRAVDLSSIPSVLYTSEPVSASSILRSGACLRGNRAASFA
jgi:hypothetical protein